MAQTQYKLNFQSSDFVATAAKFYLVFSTVIISRSFLRPKLSWRSQPNSVYSKRYSTCFYLVLYFAMLISFLPIFWVFMSVLGIPSDPYLWLKDPDADPGDIKTSGSGRLVHLHHSSKIKVMKKSQNSRIQGFSYYYCLRWKHPEPDPDRTCQ